MRPPVPHLLPPPAEVARMTRRRDRYGLTWVARCPHGRTGTWTARPTEAYERIETTVACDCPEEAA